jgi:aspartyl-tRNA synthetase
MSNFSTKEILVDVVMELIVTQRFEVPADYQFDEEEPRTSYLKLMKDYGSDMPNLTENVDFEDIDADEVLEVSFLSIGDVNAEECVDNPVELLSYPLLLL